MKWLGKKVVHDVCSICALIRKGGALLPSSAVLGKMSLQLAARIALCVLLTACLLHADRYRAARDIQSFRADPRDKRLPRRKETEVASVKSFLPGLDDEMEHRVVRRSPLSVGYVSGLKPVSRHTSVSSHGTNHHTVVIHPEKATITVIAPNTIKVVKVPGHGPTALIAVVQPVAHIVVKPEPVHLTSTTVITQDAVALIPVVDKAPTIIHTATVIVPHPSVFKSHFGGFGVGIDFGGHGSGHGFFV